MSGSGQTCWSTGILFACEMGVFHVGHDVEGSNRTETLNKYGKHSLKAPAAAILDILKGQTYVLGLELGNAGIPVLPVSISQSSFLSSLEVETDV